MTPPTPAPATREALLEHQVETLTGELARLKAEVERLQQERTVLRLRIDAMARRLFGKSSEKLDPAQLQMVFSNLALETESAPKTPGTPPAALPASGPDNPPTPAAGRKKRSLAELMEGLPVTVTTLTPPEVLACPDAWRAIGNAERTRLLDYTPGRFGVHLILRPKYVRIDASHEPPVTAPLHLLQNRCMATPRLLAGMLTLRFEQHLPYYRIEQLYARAGVPLSRETLSCWAGMAAGACGLIITATKAEVFADGYVQADETPVKYQDPARKGSCGTGYLWVFYNPVRHLSYFAWRTGRGASCLKALFRRTSGASSSAMDTARIAVLSKPAPPPGTPSAWRAALPMSGANFSKPAPKERTPHGSLPKSRNYTGSKRNCTNPAPVLTSS